MALSFFTLFSAAAAVLAGQADAAKYYKQTDVYNAGNFLNKFDFISSTDPNGGFVQYQTKANAQKLGLVKTVNGQTYIGADYTNTYAITAKGRKSVRLESKKTYNHGLFVADFTHLPKPVCGAWPAYWFFGEPWPTKGEIDIYENWNDLDFNRHTAHVDSPDVVGNCTISSTGMTAEVDSPNCYDFAPGQYNWQGCSASEYSSTFGNENGGVFAFQWTSEFLKIWDWPKGSAPTDVATGAPVPSSKWGTPSFVISACDIPSAFKDMKMTFNIDFCATAGQSDKWDPSCKAKTNKDTCVEHVALHPAAFTAAYFQVNTIKVYQYADAATKRELLLDGGEEDEEQEQEQEQEEEQNFGARSVMPQSTTSCTDDIPAPLDTPTAVLPIVSTTSSSSSSSYPAEVTSDYPEEEMTTSTIYSTRTQTITSCPPSVKNCPVGHVTTDTVVVGTTVCPVSAGKTTATEAKHTKTYPEVPESYPTTTVHKPSKETHHHEEIHAKETNNNVQTYPEETYPKGTHQHHHKQTHPTTTAADVYPTTTKVTTKQPSAEETYPSAIPTTTATTEAVEEETPYPTAESESNSKTTLTSTYYETTTVTLAYVHSSSTSSSTTAATAATTISKPSSTEEEEKEEISYVTQTVVPIAAPSSSSSSSSSSTTKAYYYPTGGVGYPIIPGGGSGGKGNGTSTTTTTTTATTTNTGQVYPVSSVPTTAESEGCAGGQGQDMEEGGRRCDEESSYPVASSPPVSGGAEGMRMRMRTGSGVGLFQKSVATTLGVVALVFAFGV